MSERRLTLVLALLLTAAAGCAHGGRPASAGHARAAPFSARILTDVVRGGTIAFHLDRPAHVAVFEIVPGAGIRVLRPWGPEGATHRSRAGVHVVDRHAFGGPPPGRLGPPIVAYGYVVACERPLRLDALAGSVTFPLAVRPVPPNAIERGSPFGIMDRLLVAVSPGEGVGCAVDHVAYWIGPRSKR